MTTLTRGVGRGGSLFSFERESDRPTRIAVTMGVITQGSAAMTAMVFPFTPQSYPGCAFPELAPSSDIRSFHPWRRLGTLGTQFAACLKRAFEIF